MDEKDTVGIPKVILDLVIETLIKCREPLPYVVEQERPRDSSYDQVFRNLSLVHRSWTSIVRRGLWSRAIIDASDLDTFPQGVERCSYLRELAFEENGSPDYDAWEQLAQVLQRSPNIRVLYLDLDVPHEGLPKLLSQLRLQTSLEVLWLSGDAEAHYRDILLTIPVLVNLKSLVLDCSKDDEDEEYEFSGIHPPRGLKSVAFTESVDWKYLAFLMSPHDEPTVTNLCIALDDEDVSVVNELEKYLPSIVSLRISTSGTDAESESFIQKHIFNGIFSEAQNVQRLTLSVGPILRTPDIILPESTKNFHIHHEMFAESACNSRSAQYMLDNDANIASIIQNASSRFTLEKRIQRVTLSFMGGNEESDRCLSNEVAGIFAKTMAACKQADISVEFKNYSSLYFADIAEDAAFTGC